MHLLSLIDLIWQYYRFCPSTLSKKLKHDSTPNQHVKTSLYQRHGDVTRFESDWYACHWATLLHRGHWERVSNCPCPRAKPRMLLIVVMYNNTGLLLIERNGVLISYSVRNSQTILDRACRRVEQSRVHGSLSKCCKPTISVCLRADIDTCRVEKSVSS